jgi:hypothetical protein
VKRETRNREASNLERETVKPENTEKREALE